jgi:hypothetical protein
VGLWAGSSSAEPAEKSLHWFATRVSAAVVLATVQGQDLVLEAEALPSVHHRQRADGTWATRIGGDGTRGTVTRMRIDDVLKSDGVLAPGGHADVHDPFFLTLEGWVPRNGVQYVLFLERRAYTDRQRLERSLVLRREPADGSPSTLVNLEATYTLVGNRRGAVRVDTLRPEALQALRDDVRAANRPSVTLIAPETGDVLTGHVTLFATSRDDGGVTGVQFQVDGQNVGPEIEQRPFKFLWRSKSVPNGAHTVRATARDATGESASAAVTVTTANTNVAPQVSASPTSATGGAQTFTWSWLDPDGDPLTCLFEVLQPTQCTFAGQCHAAGGSAAGSVSCQARVEFGQPHGTACDYRLTCSDGWAAPVSALFRLYYPNLN